MNPSSLLLLLVSSPLPLPSHTQPASLRTSKLRILKVYGDAGSTLRRYTSLDYCLVAKQPNNPHGYRFRQVLYRSGCEARTRQPRGLHVSLELLLHHILHAAWEAWELAQCEAIQTQRDRLQCKLPSDDILQQTSRSCR